MSEMECLNMDETPLEDWSKEDLIREMRRRENAFGKILDECDVTRRRGESSADALRRRLSPTAQPQPEGVGYDRSKVNPTPWRVDYKIDQPIGNFRSFEIEDGRTPPHNVILPNDVERHNAYHIVHCVNSHDRLTSLVQRLAELAREFIDDEVGCTARQYNEVNNSPCSTCPNRKLCQIIAEAGVPDETEGEKNES